MNLQTTFDKTAIGLSILCAIHCLFLPLIVTLAPASQSFALADESFHQFLIWGIIPISVFALAMGCRRHKSLHVSYFGAAGLGLLTLTVLLGHNVLGEFGEKFLTLIGGALVAYGHLCNCRNCQKENCDRPLSETDVSEEAATVEWSVGC